MAMPLHMMRMAADVTKRELVLLTVLLKLILSHIFALIGRLVAR